MPQLLTQAHTPQLHQHQNSYFQLDYLKALSKIGLFLWLTINLNSVIIVVIVVNLIIFRKAKNMNLKIKAGLIVASVVAGSIVVSFGLKLVSTYITLDTLLNGMMLIVVGILLHTMYSIILTKLTYDAKIKAMVDSK